MSRCALVNTVTGLVENFIEASPGDFDPGEGYTLVIEPPPYVDIGSPYPFIDPVDASIPKIEGMDTL